MNISYLLAVVAAILLTGCGSRSSQEQSPQESQAASPQPDLPTVPVISSMRIQVTFLAFKTMINDTESQGSNSSDGSAGGQDAQDDQYATTLRDMINNPPRIATGLQLGFEGGASYRFADDSKAAPQVAADGPANHYRFTITYLPLEGGGLIGQPVGNLRNVRTVRIRIADVLAALGLHYGGVTEIDAVTNEQLRILYRRTSPDEGRGTVFPVDAQTAAM